MARCTAVPWEATPTPTRPLTSRLPWLAAQRAGYVSGEALEEVGRKLDANRLPCNRSHNGKSQWFLERWVYPLQKQIDMLLMLFALSDTRPGPREPSRICFPPGPSGFWFDAGGEKSLG